MLTTLAIQGYRSLHDLVMPLAPLTVVTGENGSGKSNLYRALQLLADTARGRIVGALAAQGGLPSTLWAGPQVLSAAVRRGEHPLQGSPPRHTVRLRLGFASTEFGYLVELGYPTPSPSVFNLDPAIKRECLFHGPRWRAAATLVDRKAALLRRRDARRWQIVSKGLSPADSLFSSAGDPATVPEVFSLQRAMQGWRFYSAFRTDDEAPARRSMPATRTPVLHDDGRDLPAALQTIVEVGDAVALATAIDDAFPGSRLVIESTGPGHLCLGLQQPGLLRSLDVREWSDGTLRYVLLIAALLTPRPPALMVLNEPETSLHPDLLPALARLIEASSRHTQCWVISHSSRLVQALEVHSNCECLVLDKIDGETRIRGLRSLDEPPWQWPPR